MQRDHSVDSCVIVMEFVTQRFIWTNFSILTFICFDILTGVFFVFNCHYWYNVPIIMKWSFNLIEQCFLLNQYLQLFLFIITSTAHLTARLYYYYFALMKFPTNSIRKFICDIGFNDISTCQEIFIPRG